MDYYKREAVRNNYYEIAPDGSLLVVPIVRSLKEVIHEREIVAKYFESPGPIHVLSGVCDLFKAELMFESKGISFIDLKTPVSLELQHKIDIYNTITAEQVIDVYELEQKKRENKRRRIIKK